MRKHLSKLVRAGSACPLSTATLALAISLTLFAPLTAWAQTGTFNFTTVAGTGTGYSWDGMMVLTINNGADVEITGTATGGRRIEVAKNAKAKITLNGTSITGLSSDQSPLLLNDGANLTLALVGENVLTAGSGRAGIEAPEGTTLAISGAGSLSATGGDYGAGIGGGKAASSGKITISGGTVAGSISGGDRGTTTISGGTVTGSISGGTIIISGGTVTGRVGISGSKITISGGTVAIASINGFPIRGDTITISGGTVTASVGISGGDRGTITISGGTVTAFGYNTGAGISGGTITISGGTVKAEGNRGAGIGHNSGTVIISGGTVTAAGSGSYAGIAGTLIMNNENGGALVFASSVSDMSGKTSGILVIGNTTYWFGGNEFTLNQNAEVPSGYTLATLSGKKFIVKQNATLTIARDATLSIPAGTTLTNNGTVFPADGSTINVDGTVSGNKITGANAAIPKLSSKTANSITLNASAILAATGQTAVEYAINTTNSPPTSGWQASTTFSNLKPGTDYYLFARSAGNANFANGNSEVGLLIRTDGNGTPIRLSQIASSNITAKAIGSSIVLENLPSNAKAEVYNLQGKRIYSAYPENPSILKILVQTKGIYIIKAGSQTMRIAVK